MRIVDDLFIVVIEVSDHQQVAIGSALTKQAAIENAGRFAEALKTAIRIKEW